MKNNQIAQLVQDGIISQEDADSLSVMLDPFHDYEIDNTGFPDGNACKRIRICAKQKLEISKPAGFPAGNWDVNIVQSPLIYHPLNVCRGEADPENGAYEYNQNVVHRLDGTVAFSVPSGSATFDSTGSVGTDYSVENIVLDDYINQLTSSDSLRLMRVVSRGFEVENTTASLEQQGLVTDYHVPQSAHRQTIVSNDGNLILNNTSAAVFRAPPQTLEQAGQMGGASRHAKTGAYVTARFISDHNPYSPIAGSDFVAVSSDPSNVLTSYASRGLGLSVLPGTTLAADVNSVRAPTVIAPQATTGSFFSGLSDATTLTIAEKVIFEFIPGAGDLMHASMASQPPITSAAVLPLYHQIIADLPPGVARNENDFGKWFKRALGKVKDVTHKVLPYAANLAASMGRPGVSSALTMIDQALPKTKKRAGRGKPSTPAFSNPPTGGR